MSLTNQREECTAEASLLGYLDPSQLNCLNESHLHTFKPIIADKKRNDKDGVFLLSDTDEQLLLTIQFNQAVRIKSIAIQSKHPGQAPKSIKILINRPSVGFEDVEDAQEPTVAQVLELNLDQVLTGVAVPLRYVRFQSVNSLHIFVCSNQGGEDETRIDMLDIIGTPIETTKSLSELKKVE